MSEQSGKSYSKEILEIADRLSYDPELVAEVRSLSESDLKVLTESYLKEVHQSPSYWRLKPARDLATPYLIEVFEREYAFKKNDESSTLPDSPATRALSFLEFGVHNELKAHLLHWLKIGDLNVYMAIKNHLVAFGSDDLLPHVKVLFEHEDMFVSSGARGGALMAIQEGRAESEFLDYVWEYAKGLLFVEKPPSMYDPIRLLEAIDVEATKNLLLDPSVMRRDHPLLPEALGTLNSFQCPPDAAFLNSLIEDELLVPEFKKDLIRRAAIKGLILRKDPTAGVYVEQVLASPKKYSEDMVLAAWTARFELKGLKTIYDSAFESYENAGYELEGLAQEERDIILIHYLDSEVCNGGFWQWYFNDYGRFGVDTRKALKKIGATKHARVVNKANRLFGWNGPPTSRELVQEALDNMPEKKAQKMDDLNDAWGELPPWTLFAAAWDWKRQSKNTQ
ncbi:hypothetical protein Rhal01_01174 [Rubritalea halochordaticola]|uniref:DNA mimic protein DMP19 C-terminal domain-containing protein n=1 Tax=Rubritalea halochordaticola TaxID=714537 RepID=A0ABP9UZ32_9BACT